jgi:metal transporter CNNM
MERYDEHDGPRNAASAFVPREAALAARQAAIDREKALAAATPLPATNDADLDVTAAQPIVPKRTLMPKLPVKFSIGKRPISQPGRSRTTDDTKPPVPLQETEKVEQVAHPGVKRAESPEPMHPDSEDLKLLSADKQIGIRGSGADLSKAAVPASGIEPVTAVPARLLSTTGGAATPAAAPPNLLSEALMIERGRRRLAATGTPIGNNSTTGIRVASASGYQRSSAPSRQPTPPTNVGGAVLTPTSSAPGGPAQGPGIISPIPVPAQGKRGTKFKSVPTPLPPGTPSLGSAENPAPVNKDVE